jgi:carnitine monooxygenase subunit
MLPYNSPDFPEIPRQDYSNLPIQQLGLHNLDYMRIGKGANGGDSEGLISNYQRVIDGFLAGLDKETLRKAQNIANSGFQETILDIGF